MSTPLYLKWGTFFLMSFRNCSVHTMAPHGASYMLVMPFRSEFDPRPCIHVVCVCIIHSRTVDGERDEMDSEFVKEGALKEKKKSV